MVSQIALLLILNFAPSASMQTAPSPKAATGFARLQSLVETRQYLSLENGIASTRLEVAEAALFRGILANRRNRLRNSIDLLEPLAAKLAAAPASWREKELMTTLADDYSKTFEYARSEAMLSKLLQRYGASLTKREHRNFSNRLSEMHLLRAAPPQTLEKTSPSMLTAKINGMGLLEVPVTGDKNLNFAGLQIQGIIGFPVQSALGSFSVYADGRVGIDSDPPSETTAEMFMEQQTPLVSAKAGGEARLFSLDTGATGSTFSERFYRVIQSKLADH